MQAVFVAALAVAGVAGSVTMANEAMHGGVAEMMGLGHQHMADYGGYHCASHDGMHGPHHEDHMHNETGMPHGDCPGGEGMHSGGRMGGM
jgi:hypothetical protein